MHGGEFMPLEDEIHAELPKDYRELFKIENVENGNRAKREYSTIGQRKRRKEGGFGFGYHRDFNGGKSLFVERWIPSNPPIISSWPRLQTLANEKGWKILISPKEGATSIILNLQDIKVEKNIIETIVSFLDTVSQQETGMSFPLAAEVGLF